MEKCGPNQLFSVDTAPSPRHHRGMNEIPLSEIITMAGGRTAIAKLCEVDRTTTYSWQRVPPVYALRVARAIGVPAGRVREDYYGEVANDQEGI